jgi:nitrogen fixation protein FixH
MSVPQKNLYRPFILLLLGSFLGFLAWSAWQAANYGSEVSDRDYYSKGLRYTSTLLEKRAAEGLGWTLTTQISGRTLEFHIANREKQGVSGARGTLHLYLPGHADGRAFELHESSSGIYRLALPPELQGSLRARVMFERDGARLSRQLQLNL